ncbi:Uma2 family endonuclease [Synechococcus sp. R6-10]|uniref:Uma2 family endonuclease n=1 Tax=Synechococcus sp. R6-10 TaxID=2291956 RepID=UPI0039C496B9
MVAEQFLEAAVAWTRGSVSAPSRDRLSLAEYLAYSDGSDTRYELVAGELVPMALPTGRHVQIQNFLSRVFEAEIARQQLPWTVIQGGLGIQSPRGNRWATVRIPDVVVLPLEQWQEMGSREALIRLEEPPLLLVVEVVSESSRAADYRAKQAEYCVLGIGEYWVVDPLEEKVSLLLLHEGWYDVLELKGSDPVSSKVFPKLELQAGEILAADSGYSSKATGS